MDPKGRKIVDDAILKFGDDFWNSYFESLYSRSVPNREGIVADIIRMLEQAGYKLVVKPL